MNSEIKSFNIIAGEDDGQEYEMPAECPESEKALEELNKDNLKAQYDFINLIVLAFVLLASAFVFIAMTSSVKFGDEGNKFSLKRLFSGEYTAEMEQRYESTIPFPKQFVWLEERISLIYGTGNKVSDPVSIIEDNSSQNGFDKPTENQNQHDEKAVTTTTGAENTDKKKSTTKPKETAPVYKTTFKKTTTTADDFETTTTTTTTKKTTTLTTTNNDAPRVTTTTTVPPVTTTNSAAVITKPSVITSKTEEVTTSSASTTSETTTPTESETEPPETETDESSEDIQP